MIPVAMLYVGAAAVFLWGAAHLFPTASVVRNFGALLPDNRRILIMEWIGEGLTLMFAGVLVGGLAGSAEPFHPAALWAYRAAAGLLGAMALVSALTGARNRFLPFRLCPWIFLGAGALFLIASLTGG